jgi:Na+/H+ antiporter NhaA
MLLWINDALMAVFFLLIGLEVKRELIQGSLASRRQAAFPVIAALGGMIVPALVFWRLPGRIRCREGGRSRRRRISPLRSACWRCWAAACRRR